MRLLGSVFLGLVLATDCLAQSKITTPPIPRLDPPIPRIGEPPCRPGRVYGPIYDPYLAAWSGNSWGPFGHATWSNGFYPGGGVYYGSAIGFGPTVGVGLGIGYDYDYGYPVGPVWNGNGYPVTPITPWGGPIWSGTPSYQPQLQPLPQWMLEDAGFGQPEKAPPIARSNPELLTPSSPDAQLRSARMQGIGDRFLRDRDLAAAEKSYRSAIRSAADRPEPYVRLALVKIARDDYRGAVSLLREANLVDGHHLNRTESLDTILGPEQHGLKVELKQRVADWTKVNVRDVDRLYLLAMMLFLDGDERCHTILDTAIKLAGDQDHLIALRTAALPTAAAEIPGLSDPLPPQVAPERPVPQEAAPRPDRQPLPLPGEPTPIPEL